MTNDKAKKKAGRLYVVGVGPGDPELLTVRAVRILGEVPVIFAPQKDEKSESLAINIIAKIVNKRQQEIIRLVFPMSRDSQRLAGRWQSAAESIWQHLETGRDCAFVNIGDPLLYGTSIHIMEVLQQSHPDVEVEVVPGVSSINAAAAKAIVPLAINDERIAIISGHCEDGIITETLKNFDTVVFLKVQTVYDRLIDILERMKLLEKCVYVSRCTTEDEEIVRDICKLRGKKLDYLSLLIVRR
ncbi:MAG: precorrin-2 C(20)-methyltransferase [Chloroflexi bacterium]|nr:precorrin-2 C(20)-methyltransferase [Chloroflexota bacterium]